MLMGRVPTELAEEKANTMAGIMALKKATGLILPRSFTEMEYVTTMCTM